MNTSPPSSGLKSKTSMKAALSRQRYIPEDRILHNHRSVNPKFTILYFSILLHWGIILIVFVFRL
jgi:hypothetical protein